MEKEFWIKKWDENDTKFNQNTPNKYLQEFLPSLNIQPNATIFVPLCGKSIDMLWLMRLGYKIIGVEFSEKACQDFFLENNIVYTKRQTPMFKYYEAKNIRLIVGDFFNLSTDLLKKVSAVYDRAAFIALPKELREKYASHLLSLLEAKTAIFLITASYNQEEMAGPPFSIADAEIKELFSEECAIELLYDKLAEVLPSHLLERGLTKARDKIYLLHKN